MPLLGKPKARDTFLKILNQVRDRYDFGLFGFVIMPEHVHLLISEPNISDPSMVMKVLKQRLSRALRKKKRRTAIGQMQLWEEPALKRHPRFWQPWYYDFNVCSERKRNEKMNYMHFNPVRRGLVESPNDWKWSSYRFYWRNEKGLCDPNPLWEWKKWRKLEPVEVEEVEVREHANQEKTAGFRTQNLRHPRERHKP